MAVVAVTFGAAAPVFTAFFAIQAFTFCMREAWTLGGITFSSQSARRGRWIHACAVGQLSTAVDVVIAAA